MQFGGAQPLALSARQVINDKPDPYAGGYCYAANSSSSEALGL